MAFVYVTDCYTIHSSQERYEKEYDYPEGVEVINVPYNGEPFSEHTILKKGDVTLKVQFGTGGYYSDVANEHIINHFS